MSPLEFFIDLSLERWSFWMEGDRLKFRAPESVPTEEILPRIREYKSELLHILKNEPYQLSAYPLTYGQRALWYIWKLAPESSAYNQSIPLTSPLGASYENWIESFRILLDRHPMLSTRFPLHATKPIQQRTDPAVMDCAWSDLSQCTMNERDAAARKAHEAPFDLETSAAVRFRVFSEDGTTPSTVLFTMHHIICDGWYPRGATPGTAYYSKCSCLGQ
ncbi:MAG: condensation domain-containing protein [Verrucomicrobiota bacterium]